MSNSNPNGRAHLLGPRWAIIAAILGAAILVFTFIIKGSDVLDLIEEIVNPPPSPKVVVTPRNAAGGSQCLEFAFADLPSEFVLGSIRLEVTDADGPTPFAGSQAAEIETVTRNSVLPATIFFTKAPIEFRAGLQATRKGDAAYVDFCPILDTKGLTGSLSVKPRFLSPTGDEIEKLRVEIFGNSDVATFTVSYPNNIDAKIDTEKLTILQR